MAPEAPHCLINFRWYLIGCIGTDHSIVLSIEIRLKLDRNSIEIRRLTGSGKALAFPVSMSISITELTYWMESVAFFSPCLLSNGLISIGRADIAFAYGESRRISVWKLVGEEEEEEEEELISVLITSQQSLDFLISARGKARK